MRAGCDDLTARLRVHIHRSRTFTTRMPRRVFKHMSRQRHRWKARWFLRPFRALLENPTYWSLHRRNVSRAFAIGLFVAFTPLPIHIVLSAALALLLRVNIPAAVAGSLLTNPLTVVPLFMGAYWVGCQLLGIQAHDFHFEMSWEWLQTGLLPIWKPFALGCFVSGLVTAAIGYMLLGGIWHLSLVLKYHRRKATNPPRNSAS
jgi:uncharacterized protein (DUF2062 family)